MGKDKFGWKGVIPEHYPDPRILQASDTFRCQPPILLVRACASVAGQRGGRPDRFMSLLVEDLSK